MTACKKFYIIFKKYFIYLLYACIHICMCCYVTYKITQGSQHFPHLYITPNHTKNKTNKKNPADKEPFILYLWCFCFLPFSGQQRHHPPPALTNNNQHEEETSAWRRQLSSHLTLLSVQDRHGFPAPTLRTHHGDTSHRPGEAQADQYQGDRGSGERCRAEKGL